MMPHTRFGSNTGAGFAQNVNQSGFAQNLNQGRFGASPGSAQGQSSQSPFNAGKGTPAPPWALYQGAQGSSLNPHPDGRFVPVVAPPLARQSGAGFHPGIRSMQQSQGGGGQAQDSSAGAGSAQQPWQPTGTCPFWFPPG